jgi:hypothetical protein
MNWHSFPEAIYMIHWAIIGLPKRGEDTVVHIAVDARTFIEVEDFANMATPAGWELQSIEKHYYDNALMMGHHDGLQIDVKLNESREFPIEWLHLGSKEHLKVDGAYGQELWQSRKAFVRLAMAAYDKVAA